MSNVTGAISLKSLSQATVQIKKTSFENILTYWSVIVIILRHVVN